MNSFEKKYFTRWNADTRTLVTRLSGLVTLQDVQEWSSGFKKEAAEIPANTAFKLFSNLHGFTAENTEAHKAMRNIVPFFLSQHGMKPGYALLFPEEPVIVVTHDGKQCKGCAHVHHDASKINKYHNELSSVQEDFFTEPEEAEKWLNAIEL